MIDPASVFFNCNPNSESAVRRALKPLEDFAQDSHLAVLLVRHLNKSNAGNLLYQASGSTAWIAAARCALRTASDPTTNDPYRHLLVPIKMNLVDAPSMAYRTVTANGHLGVEWLGPSNFTAKDLMKGEFEDGSKLWEAVENPVLDPPKRAGACCGSHQEGAEGAGGNQNALPGKNRGCALSRNARRARGGGIGNGGSPKKSRRCFIT